MDAEALRTLQTRTFEHRCRSLAESQHGFRWETGIDSIPRCYLEMSLIEPENPHKLLKIRGDKCLAHVGHSD